MFRKRRRSSRYVSDQLVAGILLIMIAGEALGGVGYAHHAIPASGWAAAVVLGLIALPGVFVCLSIVYAAILGPWIRWARDASFRDPLIVTIDLLLQVHHELRSGLPYRTVDDRLSQSAYLEAAAVRLSRNLLPAAVLGRLGAGDWLARRAEGWAEAVRHRQRQIIAPAPKDQAKIEATLAHEIRCLINDNLGSLAWRQPPPPPSSRATLRRRALTAAQAVIVAALPLVAVLAAQPFLHASGPVFDWARIITTVWALLYVLLSIDPTLRDKVAAARDLADLVQRGPSPTQRSLQEGWPHPRHGRTRCPRTNRREV
jgi:hypothetical protein